MQKGASMDKLSLLIIIAAFFVISFFISYSIKKNILNSIKYSWGKYPSKGKKAYPKEALKDSFKAYLKFIDDSRLIDDITWNDLDMQEVFNKLNTTNSSLGAEALYRRLRIVNPTQSDQEYLDKLMKYFDENPKTREKVQYIYAKIGKLEDNKVLQFIHEDKNVKLYKSVNHLIFGLLPAIALIITIIQATLKKLMFFGPYPLLFFFALVVYNIFHFTRIKNELEKEYTMANYLTSAIYYGQKLLRYDLPIKDELKAALSPVRTLGNFSFLSLSESNSGLALISYMLNSVFRISLLSFSLTIKTLKEKRNEVFSLWKMLGDIESSISILSYEFASKNTCKPKFIDEHKIEATDLSHPLIENPVPNDVNWTKSTLVTGSNASGKSTYVKSVAINAILAQTIYLCHAKEFSMKKGNILSSMAIKDDLIEGDSYFVAEIKSLKRLIDNMEAHKEDYYFIDEILKGTNTIERIAASSSIIKHLLKNKQLAFIASHDIELTKIFENNIENIHFREEVDNQQGIRFDYKLHSGPSTTKNAIKLLGHMHFPDEIVSQAQDSVEKFEETNSWI